MAVQHTILQVRGAEALDMLLAMNTGHQGSLTTIHGNSPRDALDRLATLAMMAGERLLGTSWCGWFRARLSWSSSCA